MHSLLAILLTLPLVGAIIGYACKWMAIKMLFHPSRFIGVGPIGWQGVVQRRAPKFARGVAATVTSAGVTVQALLGRLDPAAVAGQLGPLLDAAAPGALVAVLDAVKPGAAAALPPPMKAQLLAQLGGEGRRIAAKVVDELRAEVVAHVDVAELVVGRLSGANADRLARLFQTIGARELRVVILYGAVLGFLIGLLEVGFYAALERWWLLPVIGAVDGLVNNWLAIQMIFRPLERTRYLGVFPFQGLFPARQAEISCDYGAMLATEVLAPRDVWSHLPAAAKAALVAALTRVVEREAAPMLQMAAMMLGGPPDAAARQRAIAAATAEVSAVLPAHLPALEAYLHAQLAIAATLEDTLRVMPKDRFEAVLRGIFEEDEWILVTLGGALGGAIGLVQGGLVLALG